MSRKLKTPRILAMLLSPGVMLSLVGCGAKQSDQSLDNGGDSSKVSLAENTGKIILTVKDEETGKPIGKIYGIGYPSVMDRLVLAAGFG